MNVGRSWRSSWARASCCPNPVRSAGCHATLSSKSDAPLVKVCGITTAHDAEFASKQGADLIGMIMWPKAARSVSDETAKAIAAVAAANGAQAVGVFVDEDAATIAQRCRHAGVAIAQLHGDQARTSLFDLPEDLGVIYVLHATPDGSLQTETPSQLAQRLNRSPRKVDYVLMDSMKGGSGVALDWQALQVPVEDAEQGWLLAGGLKPENVARAAAVASPTGVDVSSGVCGPDGLKKDPVAVQAFISNAKASYASVEARI